MYKNFWQAIISLGLGLTIGIPTWAQPLASATVDRLRNQVTLTPAGGSARPAQPQDVLRPQDQLVTGQASLAQLVFNDQSLMRLGQNTVFQFAADRRDFILNQGVGMMITPRGAGARIVTPAAVAAVQGSLVLAIVRPATPGQPGPNDTVTFFAFTSPIQVLDPNERPLGTIPVGHVGSVQNGEFLGSAPFDFQGALSTAPILSGLGDEDPQESATVQAILASERQVIEQVIPDLTPPKLDLSDPPNPNDLIRDPNQALPQERDITIIIQ
ncbi:MAG: FecR domain-containing protein [Thermostichales cyanobacterium BF4_bins_65]